MGILYIKFWDMVKAVIRGKFISLQAYLQEQERAQINNLTLHLKNKNKNKNKQTNKKLEKEERTRPKVSRRKDTIKIRAEINETENNNNNKTIGKINATKSWLFEKVNKVDKALARLTKEKRERTQINKIMGEREGITTDSTEIQSIMQEYYEKHITPNLLT